VIHLDTTILIDLQRELERERPAGAFEFLEALDEHEVLAVSAHVVSEFRVGAELSKRPLAAHEAIDRLVDGLLVSYPDDRFAMQFARVAASMQRSGATIGKMDLLIATAALLDDAPLVTRNVKDFSRVPGLRVLGY
jgi:predicted nucleic acid-binding protein